MSEREDLQRHVDAVLADLSIGMEGWRNTGQAPNSVLQEAKELHEEAGWEQQSDLADRLAGAIEQAEREIEHRRR